MADDCKHENVMRDEFFFRMPGVVRLVPGDCYCLDCKQPVPLLWNNGRPKPVEEPSK